MPLRDNFYSEEAHEIIGSVPSWTVRWGITVVFVIFAAIFIACYFIRYPETVDASVVITTSNPPSDLAARSEGLIDIIYASNGQQVRKGDLIAVINNPADYGSVVTVEENLKSSESSEAADLVNEQWLDKEYELGDIQSYYSELRRICMDFRHYLKTGLIDQKIMLIQEQIAKSREQYAQMEKQLALMDEEIKYEKSSFSRDSMLYAQNVLSESQYETSARSMLQKLGSRESYQSSLIGAELSIITSEQQIIELGIQRDNELETYRRQISQTRQQLLAQVNQWKQRYVIESPADGTISLSEYWSPNQWVRSGDIIATVIPDRQTQVTGRMYIPSAGFGKVSDGQTVNIKLNSYPYMEFGMLKGTIKSISAVPDVSNFYVAEVVFPNNLQTTYGKELPMIQRMDGTAEIITKDRRLIQRFLDPIKALFDY